MIKSNEEYYKKQESIIKDITHNFNAFLDSQAKKAFAVDKNFILPDIKPYLKMMLVKKDDK